MTQMNHKKLSWGLVIWALLFIVFLLCAPLGLHAQSPDTPFTRNETATLVKFSAVSTTGTTAQVYLSGVPVRHAVQVVTTGAPAACTYDTEASLDGLNWFKAITGTVCTTSGTITYTVDKPFTFLRFNFTALSGGATAQVFYVGTH